MISAIKTMKKIMTTMSMIAKMMNTILKMKSRIVKNWTSKMRQSHLKVVKEY